MITPPAHKTLRKYVHWRGKLVNSFVLYAECHVQDIKLVRLPQNHCLSVQEYDFEMIERKINWKQVPENEEFMGMLDKIFVEEIGGSVL